MQAASTTAVCRGRASSLLPSPRDTGLQAAGPGGKRRGWGGGCRAVYIRSNLSPSLQQLLAYNQQRSVQSSHAKKHMPLTFSATEGFHHCHHLVTIATQPTLKLSQK